MSALPDLLSNLRSQAAPASQLSRLTALAGLAEREPALLALFLVGSYAKGTGDRVSDLDLVAIAKDGQGHAVLAAAHEVLTLEKPLNQFTGTHSANGHFWKLVYLDFSSVEFHVFESGTTFRLKRPYLAVWDPSHLAAAYLSEGTPIQHEDFAAYEYGDDGLLWELVDCIKWLSRAKNELAKEHLKKVVQAIYKAESSG